MALSLPQSVFTPSTHSQISPICYPHVSMTVFPVPTVTVLFKSGIVSFSNLIQYESVLPAMRADSQWTLIDKKLEEFFVGLRSLSCARPAQTIVPLPIRYTNFEMFIAPFCNIVMLENAWDSGKLFSFTPKTTVCSFTGLARVKDDIAHLRIATSMLIAEPVQLVNTKLQNI